MRPSRRKPNELRPVTLTTGTNPYAEGSCLTQFGNTHVLCTATIEENVPRFLRNTGKGWVTAEYGMLPRSTHTRIDRRRAMESGRTQEISRLIGRSLRAVTDLTGFGERQIRIDCDVLQADGGTRTAAITGGYVALHLAFRHLQTKKAITTLPLKGQVAAISCGLYKGEPVLDLDYKEDSNADADANFVLSANGKIIEIQGTAEKDPFEVAKFLSLLSLAQEGIGHLIKKQQKVLMDISA